MHTGPVKALDLDNVSDAGKSFLVQQSVANHGSRAFLENGFQNSQRLEDCGATAHVVVLQTEELGSGHGRRNDGAGRRNRFDDGNRCGRSSVAAKPHGAAIRGCVASFPPGSLL
jgi:hypothetical protein